MRRQDQLDAAAARRIEVLAFVAEYLARHQHAPSVEEVTAHTGMGSTRTTTTDLAHLQREGWITRVPGVRRGMHLTAEGLDVLAGKGRPVADTPLAGAR